MIEVAQILLMRTNFVGASEPMVLSEIIYIIIKKECITKAEIKENVDNRAGVQG